MCEASGYKYKSMAEETGTHGVTQQEPSDSFRKRTRSKREASKATAPKTLCHKKDSAAHYKNRKVSFASHTEFPVSVRNVHPSLMWKQGLQYFSEAKPEVSRTEIKETPGLRARPEQWMSASRHSISEMSIRLHSSAHCPKCLSSII